jgi:ferredoxin-type protein NapF
MPANKPRREFFNFLSSSLKGEESSSHIPIIRPPYSNSESAFDTECQKCDGKCATLCQEQIIIIAEDKTPRLDFSKTGCTYCEDCAKACEFDVLVLKSTQSSEEALKCQENNIQIGIDINPSKCLSWNSTMCFSCKDPCLEDAIIFNGMFKPFIDEQKCTSCGFCISRCPTTAIDIKDIA